MRFSRAEVNLLIYQYLQDSGFLHTLFNFTSEAQVFESGLDLKKVPPAALINILQKGLQYAEEQNTPDDDGNVKELPNGLSLFDAAKSREELFGNKNNQTKQDSRKNDKNKVIDSNSDEVVKINSTTKEIPRSCVRTIHSRNSAALICAKNPIFDFSASGSSNNQTNQDSRKNDENKVIDSNCDNVVKINSSSKEIPWSCVRTLHSRNTAALICAWNPIFDCLASGSSKSSASIWDISDNVLNTNKIMFRNCSANNPIKDITSLDWNRDGRCLAAGTLDGYLRLFTDDPICCFEQLCGPIFALKFNENGNYLSSGGGEGITKIWQVDNSNKYCIQECQFHSDSIWDIAWKTNDTFASCSPDKFIYVCKVHHQQPLIKFKGHTKEINAIEWNPQGALHTKLLASCSDDKTLKIWSMVQDTCVHTFQDHTEKINTLKWSPTGSGTTNSNNSLILASASWDTTVRIFDVGRYVCDRTLMKHTEEVLTLAFSPDAKFLATGGNDRFVYVWLVETGLLVYSFKANAEILDVSWNFKGNRIAVVSSDGSIVVLDLRKM